MSKDELQPGTILVLHPDIKDPDFKNAVILVVARTDWTMGVDIAGKPALNPNVRSGGPVQAQEPQVMLIFRKDDMQGATDKVSIGDTGYGATLTPVKHLPQLELEAVGVKNTMLVSGYAGWAGGQLEEAVKAGYWRKAKISLDELMQLPPEQRHAAAEKTAPPVQSLMSKKPKPPGFKN